MSLGPGPLPTFDISHSAEAFAVLLRITRRARTLERALRGEVSLKDEGAHEDQSDNPNDGVGNGGARERFRRAGIVMVTKNMRHGALSIRSRW